MLELAHGKHYVGITTNVDRRLRQHIAGVAAGWTSTYPFVRLVYSVKTGATSHRIAEQLEDQATVDLMVRLGVEHVRGGHFCSLSPEAVERELRARGQWSAVQLAQLDRRVEDAQSDWNRDLQAFTDQVVAFHDGGGGPDLETSVFQAGLKLTRSRYWRDSYAPCLGLDFWGRKGVLPVLLTFQLDRAVGSGLSWPFEVLQAALQRGRQGRRPFAWLFLTAWEAFAPKATDHQVASAKRLPTAAQFNEDRDRTFDDFLSVLLPQLRHQLRVGGHN